MVVASIITPPHHFFIPNDNPLDPDFTHRDQECISLIKGCRNIDEFRQLHGHILKLGYFSNPRCVGSLVAECALSAWGSMEYAQSIFRQIDDPGSFEFNAMIRGYVKDMNSKRALATYLDMVKTGVAPDNYTYPVVLKACASGEGNTIHGQIVKLGFSEDVFVENSLIAAYGRCGRVGDSCAVFDRMDLRKTVASWSAVIAAHAGNGMWTECLDLFRQMSFETSSRAEESIVVNVLSACSHLGAVEWGRIAHAYVLRNLLGHNAAVETLLIYMYIRCGRLEKGMRLFREMGRRRNVETYSVAISGQASYGGGVEALETFDEMLRSGLEPDDVVYVGVLNGCSRAGLVDEGLRYFDRMRIEHGIEPTIQHYGCMVDLLGRAGRIREAFDLVETMPMKPNNVIWRSLLSSCKLHREVALGEVAARNLFRLNTKNASDYLMLASIYAQAERWMDVSKTRVKMASMRIGQVPGSSWVEVNKKVQRFVSNDMSHPQRHEIYETLHQMEWQLRFEGYRPDTSQVLLLVEEDEKKQRLRSHSQKLAIAFSLINTLQGSPIRIARNVRMCSDCHKYTKLISVIYEREIVVRDRNIFHHFRDGSCSCKDYW
ncbi:pentatricopeptide repeat-containing protein At1g31920 [Andrographis paniculata]|uniref:pentatricopeptide repeat-containing protein At1g31920 n=1 Tax=Andrographis paniculata TaxID=175694 RepID=UPI0021E80262|nr:pentatricopeptide repeat-containing protein At1g31920 [Andrographis paniculata]